MASDRTAKRLPEAEHRRLEPDTGAAPGAKQFDQRPAALAIEAIQRMADDSQRSEPQRAAQRMADARVPNRTGLPDTLKSGIEQLSGYSMDDVAVHFNSSRPAQLRAHAYTEGADIYMASGQERHLAHEAWHVVQQKQGRVAPTLMESGMPVNDDPALEWEADRMGEIALGLRPDGSMHAQEQASPASVPPRAAPLQRKVVQKLSSQIVINEDHTIEHVVVRGRPPRVHGSRMGDHTTAFIVHVEGLNVALQGLTVHNAIYKIEDLEHHIRDLLAAQGSVAPAVEMELAALSENIIAATMALNVDLSDDMATHYLQLAVNAYLRARELVPYSTINVAAVSQGLAGKGRGESRHVAVLSAVERGLEDSTDDDGLVKAIYGLFDAQAAGMVAVEWDPDTIQALTALPAKEIEPGALNRLKVIWNQHLASIKAMFPVCYARVHDRLPIEIHEKQLENIDTNNLKHGLAQAERSLEKAEHKLRNIEEAWAGLNNLPVRAGLFMLTKLADLAQLYRALTGIARSLPRLMRIDQRLRKTHQAQIEDLEQRLEILRAQVQDLPRYEGSMEDTALKTARYLNERISKKRDKRHEPMKHLADMHAVTQGIPDALDGLTYPDTPEYTAPVGENDMEAESSEPALDQSEAMDVQEESDDSSHPDDEIAPAELDPLMDAPPGTLTGATASMSIQLMLKLVESEVRIEGMLSSGRPPSPFKTSMGAHSTAWIVHLDRVRKRLMNCTLSEAVIVLKTMIGETTALADSLCDASWGDNALDLRDAARAAVDAASLPDAGTATIGVVQDMIGALLAYLNLLPTISQDAIKTTGNAEGVWRAVLLAYEYNGKGERADVANAITKLFDGKHASQQTRERHHRFIEQAYPRAAAFAADRDVTGSPGPQPVSNDLDDFSDDAGGPDKLDPSQVETMRHHYTKDNYLDPADAAGRNNCLFNAIADAAEVPPPSIDQVIQLREILNVPLGTMLAATRARLDIILDVMGLADRGAIVFYTGQRWTDSTSQLSANPLLIRHDGGYHFTAERSLMPSTASSATNDAGKSDASAMSM